MFDIYKYASDPGKELLVALEAKKKSLRKEIALVHTWSGTHGKTSLLSINLF